MAENSKIEWAHHTFRPWRGRDLRRIVASESRWRLPGHHWQPMAMAVGERHRVFVDVDVFEDWTGPMVDAKGNVLGSDTDRPMTAMCASSYSPLSMADVRGRLFRLSESTLNLDKLILTKRPENVSQMVPPEWLKNWPYHVWLGVSVENQEQADARIPHLLKTPAAVRFLSCEPLLGPVDLSAYFGGEYATIDGSEPNYNFGINWVIVGGESGPNARPCNVEWIRDIIRQCRAAGVPCFVKQVGSHPVDCSMERWPGETGRRECDRVLLCDRAGSDPSEWPEDIRVREFPRQKDGDQ